MLVDLSALVRTTTMQRVLTSRLAKGLTIAEKLGLTKKGQNLLRSTYVMAVSK